MELSAQKKALFDFYLSYKESMQAAKQTTKRVLHLLKQIKRIKQFSDPEEDICIQGSQYKLTYIVILPSGVERYLTFCFPFAKGHIPITIQSRIGIIIVKTPVSPSYKALGDMLGDVIKNQNRGVQNEQLFAEFLDFLKEDDPERVRYAHYAGEHKDMKQGCDFVVGYVPRSGEADEFEIRFQLKSSEAYIEKHKEKYPSTHLFVFQDWMIKNQERLRLTLYGFLEKCVTSRSKKAVIWYLKAPR